jgi:hypothetical protein
MCGDDYCVPSHSLLFLKSVEKGSTTLVLFSYAMYVMLYLLLHSGVYFMLPLGGLYSVLYLTGCLAKAVICMPSRRRKP